MKRILTVAIAVLAAVWSMTSQPVSAQGPLLEEYSAFLGNADHYNSRGKRLTKPWQIIRQDRANFHRFGIQDDGDQWDGFFADKANRGRMERMIMNGRIERSAARRIINSNVWIRVEIYENAVNVLVE